MFRMRKSSLYLPDLTQFWIPSISLVFAGRVHQSHLCEVGAIEWNSWSIEVGLCILRWWSLVDRWCPHCNRTGARDARGIWGQRVWCVVCHLSLVHLCGLCGFASGLYQSQCLLTRKHQRNCETTLVGTTTCFTPLVVASCDAQFDRLGHVLGCLCVPNRTLEGGVLSNRSATCEAQRPETAETADLRVTLDNAATDSLEVWNDGAWWAFGTAAKCVKFVKTDAWWQWKGYAREAAFTEANYVKIHAGWHHLQKYSTTSLFGTQASPQLYLGAPLGKEWLGSSQSGSAKISQTEGFADSTGERLAQCLCLGAFFAPSTSLVHVLSNSPCLWAASLWPPYHSYQTCQDFHGLYPGLFSFHCFVLFHRWFCGGC